jgi:hypothetical protein
MDKPGMCAGNSKCRVFSAGMKIVVAKNASWRSFFLNVNFFLPEPPSVVTSKIVTAN